jgi:hypothetical protein
VGCLEDVVNEGETLCVSASMHDYWGGANCMN